MHSTDTKKTTSTSLPTLTQCLTQMAECVASIASGELKAPLGGSAHHLSCGEVARIYRTSQSEHVQCSLHLRDMVLCISIFPKPKHATSHTRGTSRASSKTSGLPPPTPNDTTYIGSMHHGSSRSPTMKSPRATGQKTTNPH